MNNEELSITLKDRKHRKENSMKVTIKNKGDFAKTYKFLNSSKNNSNIQSILERYGQKGVDALASNTPADSGRTANSWTYNIEKKGNQYSISWLNTNVVNGCNIAVILQYGHGTKNGGYVTGRDYVNPALKPIFDKMADAVWKEVTGK